MQANLINIKQLLKLGLFFIAWILGLIGVLNNRAELALASSLLMVVVFLKNGETVLEKGDHNLLPKNKLTPNRLAVTSALIVYALLAAGGSIYFSKVKPDNPIIFLTWITSILLLLSAGLVYDQFSPPSWLLQIKNMDLVTRRQLLTDIFLIVVVTSIAFALRVPNLEHYPPGIHGDEGENGMLALQNGVLTSQNGKFVFGMFEKENSLLLMGINSWSSGPVLFSFFQSISILIFGQNATGLRMVSALAGTACIPLIYLIARKGWGKIAGFFGAWLMSVNHFHIQISRTAIGVIESQFLFLLFVLIIMIPFFPKRHQDVSESNSSIEPIYPFPQSSTPLTLLIGTGLIIGLSQYAYFGVRYWIPVMTFFIYLYQVIRKRFNIFQLIVVGLAAMIIFSPISIHFFQSPVSYVGRANTVSIFSPGGLMQAYGPGITWSKNAFYILTQQFSKNFNFFLQSGDASGFVTHNLPVFDFITSLLFWLGLGVVLSRIKQFSNLVIIFWFGVGIVLAGVITIDSPSSSRLSVISPAVYLVGGIFLQKIWDGIKNFFSLIPGITLSPFWLSVPLILCLLVGTMYINYTNYFVLFPQYLDHFLPVMLAREIKADLPLDHVYLMGDGIIYTGHGTIRYLAGQKNGTDLFHADELPPLENDGKGMVVIAVGQHSEELKLIRFRFPGGVWSDMRDPYGNLTGISKYKIPSLPYQTLCPSPAKAASFSNPKYQILPLPYPY